MKHDTANDPKLKATGGRTQFNMRLAPEDRRAIFRTAARLGLSVKRYLMRLHNIFTIGAEKP